MKLKQYATLVVGIIVGSGLAIGGMAHATGSNKSTKFITSQKAKDIVMKKVPGGTVVDFSFDKDDALVKYDATVIKDNYEYEIDVNAKTGEIIKFEKEKVFTSSNTEKNQSTKPQSSTSTQQSPTSTSQEVKTNSSYIGESKAKSIMLNKVPGGTFISFYLDNDNTPEYEAKLHKGNMEYEISVDAKSGNVIEFSKEIIDKYDNDRDDKYDDDKYDDDDNDNDDKYDRDDDDDRDDD